MLGGLLLVEDLAYFLCFYNHIWMQMSQNILLLGDQRCQSPSHRRCALKATDQMKKALDFSTSCLTV